MQTVCYCHAGQSTLKVSYCYMKKKMLVGFLMMMAANVGFSESGLPLAVAGEPVNLKLWYDKPAADWMRGGLPIGNGRLGAMIYGDAAIERIQFNEESLWRGDEDDTGAYQNFGEVTVTLVGSGSVASPSGHATGSGQDVAGSADGDISTKWCIEHGARLPVIWQAEMPSAQTQPVTSYTISSAEDVPDRDPQAWRFLGSDDGRSWTLLDERNDVPVWDKRRSAKTFAFANTIAYQWYRFEFTKVRSTTHWQVAEIALSPAAGGTTAEYRRELDLNRAVCSSTFVRDGVRFTREAFASFPAGVVVVRFTADKPAAISAVIALADAHGAKTVANAGHLSAAGAFPGYNYSGGKKEWLPLHHEARVRVLHAGGTLAVRNDTLRVEKADSLTLLLDAGTDFKQDRASNWRGPLPHAAVTARLDAAAGKSFDALLDEHLRDYRRLFTRAAVNLGGTPSEIPTDQRVTAYLPSRSDRGLEELLFQFGRYLMISSSREGGLPANLQGKWNQSNNPPWRCDYHNDINVQMNYWAADVTSLPECFGPFAAWLDSTRAVHCETTKKVFGTRGWLIRAESGLFGGSTWEWTPGTSAWLMQNLYDHYRFTGDEKYLRTLAYPALKEVSEGWLDRLETLPDGTLVAPTSFSPEQMHIREKGVAFEQQTVWDLFNSTIEAAEILGVDVDFRTLLAAKRDHLLKPKVGKWGQLQEWMSDLDNPQDKHRHISHLFAFHPGRQITLRGTPALADAVRVSLLARGDDSTGWSTAWKINQWARLEDGEHAHKLFAYLIRPCHGIGMANEGGGLYGNLLDACPPFQIDGNFGFTAGVAEMLLQSHTGEIALLPALPEAWAATGSFTGLRARGGFTVNCAWKDGRVVSFRIMSERPQTINVRINGKVKRVTSETL